MLGRRFRLCPSWLIRKDSCQCDSCRAWRAPAGAPTNLTVAQEPTARLQGLLCREGRTSELIAGELLFFSFATPSESEFYRLGSLRRTQNPVTIKQVLLR